MGVHPCSVSLPTSVGLSRQSDSLLHRLFGVCTTSNKQHTIGITLSKWTGSNAVDSHQDWTTEPAKLFHAKNIRYIALGFSFVLRVQYHPSYKGWTLELILDLCMNNCCHVRNQVYEYFASEPYRIQCDTAAYAMSCNVHINVIVLFYFVSSCVLVHPRHYILVYEVLRAVKARSG